MKKNIISIQLIKLFPDTVYRLPIFLILIISIAININADNPVYEVEGTYTYYASSSDSRDKARRIALDEARNEALKSKFGTIVQHNTMQTSTIKESRESTHFLALSSTESKGEWLADVGEPSFTFDIDPKDGTLIVTCKVTGRARAITNEASNFNATVLRNGTDMRNADTSFKSGDQMYLDFSAPSRGYVTVFLADESGQVFQMLPYPGSHIEEVKVNRNVQYKFFDPASGEDFGQVQEMLLQAPDGEEFNQIYVLFSPNVYSLPAMHLNPDNIPPSMNQEEFSNWLLKVRRADPKLGVSKINITIAGDTRATQTLRH